MANNNIIFLEKWYEDLINDEFSPLSAEEVAYIMYAAAVYEWTGEKTNFAEIFDRGDLNRVMAGFYPQIDSIRNYKVNMNVSPTGGKQAYDNDAIKQLAAQGLSQKEICRRLGYDEAKSRSLSSNRGYREGREEYLGKGIPAKESQLVSQSESQKVRSADKLTQKVSQNQSESKKLSESQLVRKSVSLSGSQNVLQTESESQSVVSSESVSQSESKNGFEF